MAAGGGYLKNWFLAGIGMFSLTRERIEEVVEGLVRAGEVDESQAAALAKQLGERAEAERLGLEKLIRGQVNYAVKNMGVASTAELRKISERIDRIEKLLD